MSEGVFYSKEQIIRKQNQEIKKDVLSRIARLKLCLFSTKYPPIEKDMPQYLEKLPLEYSSGKNFLESYWPIVCNYIKSNDFLRSNFKEVFGVEAERTKDYELFQIMFGNDDKRDRFKKILMKAFLGHIDAGQDGEGFCPELSEKEVTGQRDSEPPKDDWNCCEDETVEDDVDDETAKTVAEIRELLEKRMSEKRTVTGSKGGMEIKIEGITQDAAREVENFLDDPQTEKYEEPVNDWC